VDGERWFNVDQTRSQLDDVAYARLPSDAFHHPSDVSFHFREQEDGHCRSGTRVIFSQELENSVPNNWTVHILVLTNAIFISCLLTALCKIFLQSFDAVGLTTRIESCLQITCYTYPKRFCLADLP